MHVSEHSMWRVKILATKQGLSRLILLLIGSNNRIYHLKIAADLAVSMSPHALSQASLRVTIILDAILFGTSINFYQYKLKYITKSFLLDSISTLLVIQLFKCCRFYQVDITVFFLLCAEFWSGSGPNRFINKIDRFSFINNTNKLKSWIWIRSH